MAVVFPSVMSAYLARTEIVTYFGTNIRRGRLTVPQHPGPWPFLAVFVTDNVRDRPAGSGEEVLDANYAAIAAAEMPADKGQDQVLGEMIDALTQAARNLVYRTGGYAADMHVGSWAGDDNLGEQQGNKVWVEIPLTIQIMPV